MTISYRSLHWAARLGHIEILEYLCEQGADVNATNYIGNTPLHVALYYQQEKVVSALLKRKPKLDLKNCGSILLGIKEEFTALHYAVLYLSDKEVRLLLEHGATVDMPGVYQLTPLHVAARQNDLKKVELLLAHRHKIDPLDQEQRTPLHHAAIDDSISRDMIALLVKYGANANLIDQYDKKPLHYLIDQASESSAEKALALLLNTSEEALCSSQETLRIESRQRNELSFLLEFSLLSIRQLRRQPSANQSDISSNDNNAKDQLVSTSAPPPPLPPPIASATPQRLELRRSLKSQQLLEMAEKTPTGGFDVISALKNHPKFQQLQQRNNSSAKEEQNEIAGDLDWKYN